MTLEERISRFRQIVGGLLSYRVGAYHRAAEFLEEYLLRHPDEEDVVHIRAYLRTVWVTLTRMN